MAAQIRRVQQIAPGERASLEFPEMNLNSYVHEYTAQSGDLQDGGIRLVEPGVVMLCGRSAQAGDLPIAAKFRIQPNADQAYQLEGVATRVIDTGGALGWVAVPNFVIEQTGPDGSRAGSSGRQLPRHRPDCPWRSIVGIGN